eukprot:4980691-Pyramimonas_sp.AAC.1
MGPAQRGSEDGVVSPSPLGVAPGFLHADGAAVPPTSPMQMHRRCSGHAAQSSDPICYELSWEASRPSTARGTRRVPG